MNPNDTTVIIKQPTGFNRNVLLMHVGDQKQGAYTREKLRYRGYGYDIVIPEWFYTDGGSIPWLLQWWVKPWGKYYLEFLLHDYMYFSGEWTREECDTLLKKTMQDAGAWDITAYTVFYSLRAFGGIAWRKHRGNQTS